MRGENRLLPSTLNRFQPISRNTKSPRACKKHLQDFENLRSLEDNVRIALEKFKACLRNDRRMRNVQNATLNVSGFRHFRRASQKSNPQRCVGASITAAPGRRRVRLNTFGREPSVKDVHAFPQIAMVSYQATYQRADDRFVKRTRARESLSAPRGESNESADAAVKGRPRNVPLDSTGARVSGIHRPRASA